MIFDVSGIVYLAAAVIISFALPLTSRTRVSSLEYAVSLSAPFAGVAGLIYMLRSL